MKEKTWSHGYELFFYGKLRHDDDKRHNSAYMMCISNDKLTLIDARRFISVSLLYIQQWSD